MKNIEVRHLLKAIALGMKPRAAAKVVVDHYRFHGGNWNPNNHAKIDYDLIEGLLKALVTSQDPTVLFHTEEEWTYGGDKEDGRRPDVTAIRYKKSRDSKFSLPYHPNPESYDLPWYDTKKDAKKDAELLNKLVSELFGMEEEHERRMKLLAKGRKKDVRILADSLA